MALSYHTSIIYRCCLGRSARSYNTDETVTIFSKSLCKKDCEGKSDVSSGPEIVVVGPTACKAFRSSMLSCTRCTEGWDPWTSRSTMSQQHGYNTRNGYTTKVSRSRTEWGRNKTYYKAINDCTLLPIELKRLMAKTIFKLKLKQVLLNHFNL